MKVLIATDAWHPQINGVVRTLDQLRRNVTSKGATVELVTPERFCVVRAADLSGPAVRPPEPA